MLKGTSDGSLEGTPTFEVEIKGALELTIALHLKMHMVAYLSVQKMHKNDWIKSELEEVFYVALEGKPMISL